MTLRSLNIARGPTPRAARPFTATMLSLSLGLSALTGCGGGGGGIGAVDSLPPGTTGKASSQAEACDDGDLDACNWLGIWFMVGGAGKDRRREGVCYIQHACDEGHDKACRLLAALRKAANSQ